MLAIDIRADKVNKIQNIARRLKAHFIDKYKIHILAQELKETAIELDSLSMENQNDI